MSALTHTVVKGMPTVLTRRNKVCVTKRRISANSKLEKKTHSTEPRQKGRHHHARGPSINRGLLYPAAAILPPRRAAGNRGVWGRCYRSGRRASPLAYLAS